MNEIIAGAKLRELAELEAKATPVDAAELLRYELGGGSWYIPDGWTLIADFYNESDREFFYALRNAAPALLETIKQLREALQFYVDCYWALAPLLQSHAPLISCGCGGCVYQQAYEKHRALLARLEEKPGR